MLQTDKPTAETTPLVYGKIPVANVWLLFLYAHDLARFQGSFKAEIEQSPDFKSLIARLLCHVVEIRLRRNLSFGFRRRSSTLKRVRGRIDILETQSRDLFRRGEIACRFDELTIDTPRNRLLRAALGTLGRCLDDQALANKSKSLADAIGRTGVSSHKPSRSEIASDQIGRHEAEDQLMVSLARAVFDLVLPTENEGQRSLFQTQRQEIEFRKLFERAVGNFFALELPREDGWRVYPGKRLYWPTGSASTGMGEHLPNMVTDFILENESEDRRIIVDTKFTDIMVSPYFGNSERFTTSHIYQIYSYLRSQERYDDPRSLNSEGMLLYPAVSFDVDEAAYIQGHFIRFATIDHAKETPAVVEYLRQLPCVSRIRPNINKTQSNNTIAEIY